MPGKPGPSRRRSKESSTEYEEVPSDKNNDSSGGESSVHRAPVNLVRKTESSSSKPSPSRKSAPRGRKARSEEEDYSSGSSPLERPAPKKSSKPSPKSRSRSKSRKRPSDEGSFREYSDSDNDTPTAPRARARAAPTVPRSNTEIRNQAPTRRSRDFRRRQDVSPIIEQHIPALGQTKACQDAICCYYPLKGFTSWLPRNSAYITSFLICVVAMSFAVTGVKDWFMFCEVNGVRLGALGYSINGYTVLGVIYDYPAVQYLKYGFWPGTQIFSALLIIWGGVGAIGFTLLFLTWMRYTYQNTCCSTRSIEDGLCCLSCCCPSQIHNAARRWTRGWRQDQDNRGGGSEEEADLDLFYGGNEGKPEPEGLRRAHDWMIRIMDIVVLCEVVLGSVVWAWTFSANAQSLVEIYLMVAAGILGFLWLVARRVFRMPTWTLIEIHEHPMVDDEGESETTTRDTGAIVQGRSHTRSGGGVSMTHKPRRHAKSRPPPRSRRT